PDLIDEPMMEEDHTVLEAPSVEQATEKPSILPPTSSPSRSDVEEAFDLSNFMFKDEGNHGEKIVDSKDTMEEVEHLQQDSKEANYLSNLEDCLDGEEPEEITSFFPPSSSFQAHALDAIEDNIQEQQPALHNSPLEP
ncbi:hypothetical protein KI387_011043, partial [Taxus chinensis]